MRKSYVLDTGDLFAAAFARCCRDYRTLSIAVAWCGNPEKILPYDLLKKFRGAVKAIVGIAFNHTHPDAIEWFGDIGADIRIFRDDTNLFHPKVYLFRDRQHYALFIGSSNLTYGGFYENHEINCLIEGTAAETPKDIASLERTFAKWRTREFSFQPTPHWLGRYRRRYNISAQKQRKQGIPTPSQTEEETPTAGWLGHADWDIYYRKVLEGLQWRERGAQEYHDVLDAAGRELPVPWKTGYFGDIEKRRIMGGIGRRYGALGHTAASGQFRHLLAEGSPGQRKKMVAALNAIASLDPPIPWPQLQKHLDRLMSLGQTMKVWSRLLCIVRPDLYCTVAAPSVRRNLSETLAVPQNGFDRPQGYIRLIGLIHASPWFNSNRPKNNRQAAVWERRAAFLDAIFYSEKR